MNGGARREFGSGWLFRACERVWATVVLQFWTTAALVPSGLVAAALVPDVSNAPLYALAALPVGPALAAALHCGTLLTAGDDPAVGREFRRRWVSDARDVLAFWVPAVAVVTALLAGRALDPTGGTGPLGLVVAAGVVLWAAVMLVLVTAFSFRTRDAARLAVHVAVRFPGLTLVLLAVGAVLVAVSVTVGSWAAVGLLAVAAQVVAAAAGPARRAVRAEHTENPEGAEPAVPAGA
ncbi:hypothetical protein [Kineococcus terrestris]|uniref:hypothetical protein n=1 Tax=Kineococcus terrestris TaxID=2044856 RepID=UPI0034DAD8A7